MKTQANKIFGTTLLLCGFLLCGLGLWLLLSPNQYMATVRIRVSTEPPDNEGRHGILYNPGYDSWFVANVPEEIRTAILTNVVTTLDLNKIWGAKYAGAHPLETHQSAKRLAKMLDVVLENPKRSFDGIWGISVTSKDPNEASQIANGIVEEYRRWRVSSHPSPGEIKSAIETLQKQFREEEVQISTLQTNVSLLQQANSHPSYEAEKQKLEQNIELHKLVGLKIDALKIDLQLPQRTTVRIGEKPEVSNSPCGPNRLFGAISLASGLVLSAAGLFLISRKELI